MPDWLGVAPISDLLPAEHEHLRRQIRFELDTYVNAEPAIPRRSQGRPVGRAINQGAVALQVNSRAGLRGGKALITQRSSSASTPG